MSYSFTTTDTQTFTATHAKYIAAKVAADLKRMQRFYDYPLDDRISGFEAEITSLLKHGYLKKVWYGFQRNDEWIEPTLIYEASDLCLPANDDPGRVKAGKDVTGASFCSFLEYSQKWYELTESKKDSFRQGLPFQRTTGDIPGISGYLDSDLTYSSGGRSLSRSSVRSYS